MRSLLLILLAPLIAVSAFGQHVTDNLHLLTNDEVSRLESSIGSHPIYIETLDSVSGDLKSYADSKVQSLTSNGKAVLIVVTIHPKAWRISEWPHGLVSVQAIGDTMANQFKHGQFFAGFSGAARDIDYAVTHPAHAPPVKTVTTTTTHVQTHTAMRPVAYARGYDPGFVVFLWFIWLVALSLIIWAIVEASTSRTVVIHDRDDGPSYTPGGAPVDRSTARHYYNQYSPAQRQAIAQSYVGQPGYYPGIYRDPMGFYMFLMTMNALTSHPYYGYGYGMGPNGYMGGGGAGSDIVTDTTTTTTTETQSQADDAGAGGGWGASPAPDSDSSGGGGSWSSDRRDDPSPSTDFGSSSSDSGSGGSFDSGGGGSSDGGGGSW